MYYSYQKSIFVFILFVSVYIESCKGKGGAKKEFNGPGGAGTEDAINDYSDVMTEFTDNPQGENHKKLKSTNTSKSAQRSDGRFTIGAFNLHKLGSERFKKKPNLLNLIVRIVMRYDLLAVLEITGRRESAIEDLIKAVNKKSKHEYHYNISQRVGRTKKEQYAIIYRIQRVEVNQIIYDDSTENIFTWKPLIAEISFKGKNEVFGLVVIHVNPEEAVKEINALAAVPDWIENTLKIKDVIIIGDLNADCTHVRKKDWSSINLRNQDKYLWLIGDDADTTVASGSKCAYDRIVISGAFLQSSVIPKSGKAFKFDQKYDVEEKDALQVSERYPVEFAIRFNETVTASTGGGLSIFQHSVYYNARIFISSQPWITFLPIVGAIPALWQNPLW